MKTNTLKTAIAEAERFLVRAKKLDKFPATNGGWSSYPKQTGAVRRSSMDLTRALADLRRAD